MCDKAISENSETLKSLFLIAVEIKKCVIKLLIITVMH